MSTSRRTLMLIMLASLTGALLLAAILTVIVWGATGEVTPVVSTLFVVSVLLAVGGAAIVGYDRRHPRDR